MSAPAQRGGEAVDREAVQRRIDLTLKSVARFVNRTAKTPGERQSIVAALADAQADVALLAARGDAPVQSVSAEQVIKAHPEFQREYGRAIREAPSNRTGVSSDDARKAYVAGYTAFLAALGIEVRR